MERSDVQLTPPARTTAILALSEISRQFNYLLLKLDKYFLTITLQRARRARELSDPEDDTHTHTEKTLVYPGVLMLHYKAF